MAQLKEEYGESALEDYNVEPQDDTVPKTEVAEPAKKVSSVGDIKVTEGAGRTIDGKNPVSEPKEIVK